MPVGIRRQQLCRWCSLCILLAATSITPVFGQTYIRAERTVPESTKDLEGPLSIAFPEEPPKRGSLLPEVRDVLKGHPPFISDLKFDVNVRSYYFMRGLNDDAISIGLPDKNEAWALGGSIAFESGWLRNTFAVGAELFTSQPLSAPDDRPGTGLLMPPNADGITVLGQANLKFKLGRQLFTIGRQKFDKPFLNGNDSRMIPNTFEALSFDGRWRHGRFLASYTRKIKRRVSDNFVYMSEAVGVMDQKRGLATLGIRYENGEKLQAGIIASLVPDVFSTVYSELDTSWDSGESNYRLGVQFIDQRSVGDDLLTGEEFDTQSVGARFAVGFRNAILSTALTIVSDGARIRSPYGGSPSYNALMLSNFDLANQKTFRLGLSYDFARVGTPWLSGFINYAYGFDAVDAQNGESLPDNDELDLTIDIKPKQKSLRGMWLRLRGAVLNPDSDRRIYNYRIILNWPFPLI